MDKQEDDQEIAEREGEEDEQPWMSIEYLVDKVVLRLI